MFLSQQQQQQPPQLQPLQQPIQPIQPIQQFQQPIQPFQQIQRPAANQVNRPTDGAELAENVPDEIVRLVESLKKLMREQKAYRDQKFDVDPIRLVDRQVDEFVNAFERVAMESELNSKLIQQIRDDTTKMLRHAELASCLLRSHLGKNPTKEPQNTTQQPAQQQQQSFSLHPFQSFQLQPETQQQQLTASPFRFNSNFNLNSIQTTTAAATTTTTTTTTTSNNQQHQVQQQAQYFEELANQFEARMKDYGDQIKDLKLSLDNIIRAHNPDELFKWLKKQHETLGEIAAKVYMVHEKINGDY